MTAINTTDAGNGQATPASGVADTAASAEAAGMSSTATPGQPRTSCNAQPATSYVPCDITKMEVTLTYEGGSQTVSVGPQRRAEPVAATVPATYHSTLGSCDLLIEALAPVEETETTMSRTTGATTTKASKGHKPLAVKAVGTYQTTCGNGHEEMTCSGPGMARTVQSTSLDIEVSIEPPSAVGASRWARVWPFGDDISQMYEITGSSCGVNPAGAPVDNLKVGLMVMPDESWKITLGLGTYSSGSITAERASGVGVDRAQTGHVITRKRQTRGSSSQRREAYVARTDYSDEVSVSETSGILRRTTETLTESDSTWGTPDLTEKTATKTRKIKIEHTVGGQKAEVDASKVIDGVLKALDTIEDLSKLFDGIPKVGWSISSSFKFLEGEATFEWGHRWPASYPEEDRVHYVERYLSVGGTVDLAAGRVEVFFGIEIDPWWLDVYFVAKLYLEVKAKVSISPTGTVTATNWQDIDLDLKPLDLDAAAEIKAELGATTGGRAFGYEVTATLALKSSIELKVDGQISRKGPEAKSTLKAEGAEITGEIIVVGRRRKKYDFEPLEVIKDRTFFEDKVLF